jgi:methyl-accepting chemotaxis protein
MNFKGVNAKMDLKSVKAKMSFQSLRTMMTLQSVRAKTLATILPIIIAILIAVLWVTFVFARTIIIGQTEHSMNQQLDSITNKIGEKLTANSTVAEMTARMTEKTGKLTLSQYQKMTQNGLAANPETYGIGVFFEPFAYEAKTEYFSTYSFRDKAGIQSTEIYNFAGFEYLKQPWYEAATAEKKLIYTEAFLDTATSVTMLSAVMPMFDEKQKLLGAASANMDLTTMQTFISETKVGETGWAFLLDKNGTYIAGRDIEKIMNVKLQDDGNPELARLGKTIVQKGYGNLTYDSGNGVDNAFFQTVPGTGWYLCLVIPEKELAKPLTSLMTKLAIIGLVGILLAVLVILFYAHTIMNQLKRLNGLSVALAAGDFTHSLPVRGKDEFARMADNFNRTTEQMRQMLSNVKGHALQVAATSQELSASAEETNRTSQTISQTVRNVATGAENQLHNTAESARAMEEMAVGIQRIALSSSNAAESSHETSQMAVQGNDMIGRSITGMERITKSVVITSEAIDRLDARSKQIGQIIAVIGNISNQTNILSLNAGIEAARAGEHGRGFAVVATEVRKLSEATKQSAEHIAELIQDMQKETKEAVAAMASGIGNVQEGTALVRQTGELIEEMLLNMRQVGDQIEEVSAASEQLSAGSEQVTASTAELSHIAKGAAESARSAAASSEKQLDAIEQISASAESLSIQMQDMQAMIQKFKVS